MATEHDTTSGVDAPPTTPTDSAADPAAPAEPSTSPADTGDDPSDDLVEARRSRDQAKAKRREAEAEADALQTRLAGLERTNALLQTQYEQATNALQATEAELEVERGRNHELRDAFRKDRRQQIAAAVESSLRPDLAGETTEFLLDGLYAKGDLDPEQPDAVHRALEVIGKRHPGMLRPVETASPPVVRRPTRFPRVI